MVMILLNMLVIQIQVEQGHRDRQTTGQRSRRQTAGVQAAGGRMFGGSKGNLFAFYEKRDIMAVGNRQSFASHDTLTGFEYSD
jgi:hypothetical protein